MKRTTLIFLLLLFLFSFSTFVAAEDKQTLVTYGFSDNYVVSIPTELSFASKGDCELTMAISEINIGYNDVLNISIKSEKASESTFYLTHTTDSKYVIPYKISMDSQNIIVNEPFLSIKNKDLTDGEITKNIYFKITEKGSKTGDYGDSLTFYTKIDKIEISDETSSDSVIGSKSVGVLGSNGLSIDSINRRQITLISAIDMDVKSVITGDGFNNYSFLGFEITIDDVTKVIKAPSSVIETITISGTKYLPTDESTFGIGMDFLYYDEIIFPSTSKNISFRSLIDLDNDLNTEEDKIWGPVTEMTIN